MSQSTTFSKVIDRINGNEYGYKLLSKNNKYYILSRGILDPNINDSKFIDYLITLDSLTDEISFYNFLEYSRNGSVNAMVFVKDTIHIFGFNNRIPSIWKIFDFSDEGDSLDILLYDELIESQVFAQGIQVKVDIFYLAGRTWGKDNWTNDEDLVIIKIDEQGNKIKEERFWDIARPDMQNVIWDFHKLQ